jgi:hypothetical protein
MTLVVLWATLTFSPGSPVIDPYFPISTYDTAAECRAQAAYNYANEATVRARLNASGRFQGQILAMAFQCLPSGVRP